jgi:hypothetical protein
LAQVIDADDLAQMQADALEIRGDYEVSLAFRRGASSLAAQPARIARTGTQANVTNTAGAQQQRMDVIVMGGVTLDIAPHDRFTLDGVLYEVTFVRPNRRAATFAEAQAVE